MNEAPKTANRRARRSKALRIALTAFMACYLGAYAASTTWSLSYRRTQFGVGIGGGAIFFVWEPLHWIGNKFEQIYWSIAPVRPSPWFERWPKHGANWLAIPLWLPLLPLLAIAALLAYRDRTRRPPGHCPKCNYNLTGNTSGRCPECGTPIPGMARSKRE